MEAASGRRVGGARNCAPKSDELTATPRIGTWSGGKKRLCVGMTGCGKDALPRSLFDDLPKVEDDDPGTDVLDHLDIVGDHNVSEPMVLL